MSSVKVKKVTYESGYTTYKIDGKTKRDREKQIAQVPIGRFGTLAELRAICRDRVCTYCGGGLNLATIRNWDCGGSTMSSRMQEVTCSRCSKIERGVNPQLRKKVLAFIKKEDVWLSDRPYEGYGKGRRYNYYELGVNIDRMIRMLRDLERSGLVKMEIKDE